MHRCKPLNRFQFYNKAVLDQQIYPKAFGQSSSLKNNINRPLPINFNASRSEAIGQNDFIRRFEQSGPNFLVNMKSTIDRNRSQFFNIQTASFAPLRLCVKLFYTRHRLGVRLAVFDIMRDAHAHADEGRFGQFADQFGRAADP